MKDDYEYVLQDSKYDCGIASLITIYLQYGINISKERILELVNIDEGVSAYDLINASNILGIPARGVKGSLKDLAKDMLPCIAHIIKDESYYHYIVILENNYKNKTLICMDPAEGIVELSYESFNNSTTGIFILFLKSELKKEKDKRFKKVLINILKDNKKIITFITILSLLFIILSISYNYYIKSIIDVLNKKSIAYLSIVFFIFFSIYLFKNLINYLKNKLVINLNMKLDKKETKKVTTHIISLPYSFFTKRTTGELSSVICDIENFKTIIEKIFITCIIDTLVIISIIIFLISYSFIFSIIYIIFFIFIIFYSYKNETKFNNKYQKLKNDKIKFNSCLINILSAFDTIKNLHIEKNIINKVNNNYKDVLNTNKDYLNSSFNYSFVINNLVEIFYLILIFLSAILVLHNKINVLDLVLFSNLFYFAISYMLNISEIILSYRIYQSSINKVLDILDIEKEEFNEVKINNIRNIMFQDVSFILNNKNILNNVTLNIKKKDKVFITGKSGIGKSTLIKILLKYFKASKGKILIDNIDIKYLDLEFIRNNITYVSQQEVLFNDTIKNNFKVVTESSRLINKAIKTCLVDKIFKNKKINSNYIIEENGNNLSGGERKKLIIARALLKAKSVIVFDESFNEIDVQEERIILKNIFKNYPKLIVILISHRKNNLNLFNNIYELKEEK